MTVNPDPYALPGTQTSAAARLSHEWSLTVGLPARYSCSSRARPGHMGRRSQDHHRPAANRPSGPRRTQPRGREGLSGQPAQCNPTSGWSSASGLAAPHRLGPGRAGCLPAIQLPHQREQRRQQISHQGSEEEYSANVGQARADSLQDLHGRIAHAGVTDGGGTQPDHHADQEGRQQRMHATAFPEPGRGNEAGE